MHPNALYNPHRLLQDERASDALNALHTIQDAVFAGSEPSKRLSERVSKVCVCLSVCACACMYVRDLPCVCVFRPDTSLDSSLC